MAPSLNQFAQTTIQGVLDGGRNFGNIAVQVAAGETDLVPAMAVKVTSTASGGIPQVEQADLDTDDIYGFINYDPKINSYGALDIMTISAYRGNWMWMTASAAIERNAKLMVVIASTKVATATTGKTIIGRAIDKADKDGDLIRVFIDLPGVAD